MSLAMRWGREDGANTGFLYFDAVTVYTQNYSGTVTKHPVDQGANISDHFIKNNPTITISAVITDADISVNSYLIADAADTETPYNVMVAPAATSVNSSDQSVLQKILPGSAGQFLGDTTPDIVMANRRDSNLPDIKDMLTRLVYGGVRYNEVTKAFDSIIQSVQLYEYTGTTLVRSLPSNDSEYLVITNLAFKEDINTGTALHFDITFEQVTFAYLTKTSIPKDVTDSIKKAASDKADKGKVDSTAIDNQIAEEEISDDRDPERTAFGDVVNSEQFQIGQPLSTGSL